MPVIGQEIFKQIDLITDGAWVKVLTNPKPDAMDDLSNDDSEDTASKMLSRIIQEWNFTDASEQVVEITPENVKLALSQFDIAVISKTLGLDRIALSDKKKDSSSSPSTKKLEGDHQSNTSS